MNNISISSCITISSLLLAAEQGFLTTNYHGPL